jgi:hypothetical protein
LRHCCSREVTAGAITLRYSRAPEKRKENPSYVRRTL